jgi:hypothetical protein
MQNVVAALTDSTGETLNRLNSNTEFVAQFNKLVKAELDLAGWANSHVSMDGFGAAFEAEKKASVEPVFAETVTVAKRVLGK